MKPAAGRRICVVTATRAEYGLLRGVMQGIADDAVLELQTVVAGMHLLPEFGETWREIERDGFRIDRKVALFPPDASLRDDSPVGIARAMGMGLGGFAEAFEALRPDLIVLLGDRFEMLSAATAALVARIPVAHLHGGEATEGLIDEAIRHSITKMSQLHFVAAEAYRRRVIQLGEQPERVFLVGGLGVDAIRNTTLLGREALENALGFRLDPRSLLVTFHPVTLEDATAGAQMGELLAALDGLRDTQLVFTLPNADTDGRVLIGLIEDFVARHDNAKAFASLGPLRYLSCLAQVDGVIGNSSSGLLEAPSFRKGTVNIGERQRGRLRAASVIDCEPTRASIAAALDTLFSLEFQTTLPTVRNPYGEGGASEKIVATLKSIPLDGLLKKRFHDLDPGIVAGSVPCA